MHNLISCSIGHDLCVYLHFLFIAFQMSRVNLVIYYADMLIVFIGVSQGVESLVRGRVGGSAELGCSFTPTSNEATTPNLFPLHVVEWVRLGYNVPVLIKFGVYAPRVHPSYKGKCYSDVLSHAELSQN